MQKNNEENNEMKFYLFSGNWTWGCWATSFEKACEKHDNEMTLDDLDMDTANSVAVYDKDGRPMPSIIMERGE